MNVPFAMATYNSGKIYLFCTTPMSIQTPKKEIYIYFFFFMKQQPLVGQGLLIIEASRSHSDTLQSYDSSGRGISPIQRPLLTTHNTDKTQTSTPPGGIRTQNPSKLAAEDPRFRPRRHRDRQETENSPVIYML